MSNFDRHLLLCDPLPDGETARFRGGRMPFEGLSGLFSKGSNRRLLRWQRFWPRSPSSVASGRSPFSSSAAAVVSKALPDSSGCDSLVGSVCVMSAAIRVVANRHLSANHKVSRRDSIALALWSALSYQRPLAEQRLEDVRAEMLNSARRTGSGPSTPNTRPSDSVGPPIPRRRESITTLERGSGSGGDQSPALDFGGPKQPASATLRGSPERGSPCRRTGIRTWPAPHQIPRIRAL